MQQQCATYTSARQVQTNIVFEKTRCKNKSKNKCEQCNIKNTHMQHMQHTLQNSATHADKQRNIQQFRTQYNMQTQEDNKTTP